MRSKALAAILLMLAVIASPAHTNRRNRDIGMSFLAIT